MSDISGEIIKIAQDIDPVPSGLTVDMVDRLIEKTREQKVLIQELHISFIQQYGYGYLSGGREPRTRDKTKITKAKWDNVRSLAKKILDNLDRRLELLIDLRERSENG